MICVKRVRQNAELQYRKSRLRATRGNIALGAQQVLQKLKRKNNTFCWSSRALRLNSAKVESPGGLGATRSPTGAVTGERARSEGAARLPHALRLSIFTSFITTGCVGGSLTATLDLDAEASGAGAGAGDGLGAAGGGPGARVIKLSTSEGRLDGARREVSTVASAAAAPFTAVLAVVDGGVWDCPREVVLAGGRGAGADLGFLSSSSLSPSSEESESESSEELSLLLRGQIQSTRENHGNMYIYV